METGRAKGMCQLTEFEIALQIPLFRIEFLFFNYVYVGSMWGQKTKKKKKLIWEKVRMNDKIENPSLRGWRQSRSVKLSRAKESKHILQRKASKQCPRETRTETLSLLQSTMRVKTPVAWTRCPRKCQCYAEGVQLAWRAPEELWGEMSVQNSASLLRKGRVSNSQWCRNRQKLAPASTICGNKENMIKSVMLSFLYRRDSVQAHFPICVVILVETNNLLHEKYIWKVCVILRIVCPASQD